MKNNLLQINIYNVENISLFLNIHALDSCCWEKWQTPPILRRTIFIAAMTCKNFDKYVVISYKYPEIGKAF